MATKTAKGTARKVVVRQEHRGKPQYRLRNADQSLAVVVMLMGAAFAVVGAVDLALRWMPARLGTPGWEFATVTQTFTNVTLPALGLVLVTVGAIRHPALGGIWTRIAAGMFAVLALALLGLGLLYLTGIPAVFRAATPEMRDAVIRAGIKTGTEIVVYPAAFAAMSVLLWRGVDRTVQRLASEGTER